MALGRSINKTRIYSRQGSTLSFGCKNFMSSNHQPTCASCEVFARWLSSVVYLVTCEMLFSHVFDCQVMTTAESNPGKENWETFVTDKTEVS